MFGVRMRLVSGAPIASWVLMGDYLVLGLLALLGSLLRAQEGHERRQIATVFVGTVVGVTPFLVLGVALPSLLRTDRFLFWGVVPLALVPLTFAYAIVRFQFFDIHVIVRRSLLYTLTTAVVAGIYAVGIAASTLLFSGSVALLSAAPGARHPGALRPASTPPAGARRPLLLPRGVRRPPRRRGGEPGVAREFSIERLENLLTTRLSEVMHLEWAALYVGKARL